MKKLTAILVTLLVLGTAGLSAKTAIGVEIGGGTGDAGPSLSPWLSLKFEGLPYLGIGANLNSTYFNLGITADWWLIQESIGGPVNFYLGLGPYANLGFGENYSHIDFGARLPLGLQVFATKWLEIFLEVAPNLGIGFTNSSFYFPAWGVNGALGVRFWF